MVISRKYLFLVSWKGAEYRNLTNNRFIMLSSYEAKMRSGLKPLFAPGNCTVSMLSESVESVLLHFNGTQRLRELGFPVSGPIPAVAVFLKNAILRLFFNPAPKLCHRIQEENQILHSRPLCCFQVRTGGYLSNVYENAVFLKENHLGQFFQYMNAYRDQHQIEGRNLNVFISSDSDVVIRDMRSRLQANASVFSLQSITRGHTAYSPKTFSQDERDVVFGALLDLFLLKDCDMLVTTRGSTFGNLALELGTVSSFSPPLRSEMQGCSVFHSNRSEEGERVHFYAVNNKRH